VFYVCDFPSFSTVQRHNAHVHRDFGFVLYIKLAKVIFLMEPKPWNITTEVGEKTYRSVCCVERHGKCQMEDVR
jgi:hypothetical protein